MTSIELVLLAAFGLCLHILSNVVVDRTADPTVTLFKHLISKRYRYMFAALSTIVVYMLMRIDIEAMAQQNMVFMAGATAFGIGWTNSSLLNKIGAIAEQKVGQR